MTINLKAATASSLGGVTVDKDSTGTITLSSGNIYLTKDNVVAALGYTPGNVASEKTYTAIFGSSTTGTTAVTAATSNPYLNLLQTVSGTSTVASTLQFAGSGNVTVSANDTKITFGLNAATSSNYGGIKIGFSTNATNRNYAVQLSSG
jgi:S-formylglutathione hydrolase FrmB